MKKTRIFTLILAFLLSFYAKAQPADTPLAHLVAMVNAQKNGNYEQLYIFMESAGAESWRYRHTKRDNEQYAQLLGLDGARQEFIQQGNIVGYFGDFQPFSLQTDHIFDNRPLVMFADFAKLEGYSFVEMGRERIANRVARAIRILPNDDFRYQYRVWLDDESNLLLKSELLDQSQNVLERFRVVALTEDDALETLAGAIQPLFLPPLIPSSAPVNSEQLSWQPKWLPKGFKLQSVSTESVLDGEKVESQLYSDGLFSFSIYRAERKAKTLDEHSWLDGKTTVYTRSQGGKDWVIIGEIPLHTARLILQEMTQNAPLAGGEK